MQGKYESNTVPQPLIHPSPSKMRALVQSYWPPRGDGCFNSWSDFKMESLLKASSLLQPLTLWLRGVKPIKKINPKVLNFEICWASFCPPHFKYERGERKGKKGSSQSAHGDTVTKKNNCYWRRVNPAPPWLDAAYITVALSFWLTTYKLRKEMHNGWSGT